MSNIYYRIIVLNNCIISYTPIIYKLYVPVHISSRYCYMIIYSFTKYFFFVGNENITGNNNIKTGIQILYIDRYA